MSYMSTLVWNIYSYLKKKGDKDDRRYKNGINCISQ